MNVLRSLSSSVTPRIECLNHSETRPSCLRKKYILVCYQNKIRIHLDYLVLSIKKPIFVIRIETKNNIYMRTLRISGLFLMTILLVASLSSCSKSDDDDESGVNTKLIEGSWYLNLSTSYDWDKENNKPIPNSMEMSKPHSTVIWELLKQNDGFLCIIQRVSFSDKFYFHHASGNEYYTTFVDNENDKCSRIIFKSVSEHEMIVEWYENYYNPNGHKDYVVYNFIR